MRFLPAQYLADTPVADSQLARDVAGPDALVGEFYYSLSHDVWEGPAIHKHTSELVHPAMSCKGESKNRSERNIGSEEFAEITAEETEIQ